MCIAIYKPEGIEISKETLRTCYENNKHGCGFAYINKSYTDVKKIFVKKTLDFDTFWNQYERATRINPESPFLIHFRIKTHGPVNKDNCHPFFINSDSVFIHNGIISGVGTDPEKSDTRLFNEKILQNLPDGWEFNNAVQTLIEDFISHSKLVTMNVDGDVQIFNEEKGNWANGCWFSNYSWKTYTYKSKSNSSYNSRLYQYPSTRRVFSQYSMSPCDGCRKNMVLHKMKHYNLFQDVYESYCPECEKVALKRGYVEKKEEVNVAIIVAYLNLYEGTTQTNMM